MRLWHQFLIPHLPRQQLLGQHRELCALRGAGWGRKHSVVNYVFTHDPAYLVAYHYLIMNEMKRRDYNPDTIWYDCNYRGKTIGTQQEWADGKLVGDLLISSQHTPIYTEHDDDYLHECLDNLASKSIVINLTDIN